MTLRREFIIYNGLEFDLFIVILNLNLARFVIRREINEFMRDWKILINFYTNKEPVSFFFCKTLEVHIHYLNEYDILKTIILFSSHYSYIV